MKWRSSIRSPTGTTPEQILDKYIGAIGGAQRLANLTSYVAKGTYEGYDTDNLKVPVEVFRETWTPYFAHSRTARKWRHRVQRPLRLDRRAG